MTTKTIKHMPAKPNSTTDSKTPSQAKLKEIQLSPADNDRLARLCGQFDENLKLLEHSLQVHITRRANVFKVRATKDQQRDDAIDILRHLYRETEGQQHISREMIHLYVRESSSGLNHSSATDPSLLLKTPRLQIKPRGDNQCKYVRSIKGHDINFGIGPAGTGKTYLAVACAVEALNNEEVKRILLVRPAVEAGEKLGFLPGDLAQKVDPYLRPLYDALYDMLGFDQVARLIEKNVIEIAPLAFMRGRTLNHAFIILDESQNTTPEQMKMFLTRIGFGSTAVITGDVTQTDLPKGAKSGLTQAQQVLKNVSGIGSTHFDAADVVRHPLVQRIVEAYDLHDKQA